MNPELGLELFILLGMSKTGYVYIVASMTRGFPYVGITSDLIKRVWQHRTKRLVRYGIFGDITDAIVREKELKKWRRQWKIELIEAANPDWDDLYF